MKAGIISLKTFVGMEGEGYNFELVLDGKVVALVRDMGDGGEIQLDYAGKTEEDRKMNLRIVNEFMKTIDMKYYKTDILTRFHVYMGKLVDDKLFEKHVNRYKARNVVYRMPGKPKEEIMAFKHNGNIEATIAKVIEKYGSDVTIL